MNRRTLKKSIIPFGLVFSITFLFLFVLWWRFQLGMTRYFDADEYAYLHWAHNVFSGRMPYVDFFAYVMPGFMFLLAPLFIFFKGAMVFLTARVLAFGIFIGLLIVMTVLYWIMRHNRLVLLVPFFLAILPLPFDKFVEIRPDTLATVCAMVGLVLQIVWMRNTKRWTGFASGMAYGVSLIIFQKSLPQVMVGFSVAFFWSLWELKADKKLFRKATDRLLPFLSGIAVPLMFFVAWLISLGKPDIIWYSLRRLPFEINRISEMFPMGPDLFFYPNGIYYGVGGWSMPLYLNYFFWSFGILFGVFRFVTPLLPRGKAGFWEEILVSGVFLANIFFFLNVYPLRHAQYLIPISVFVIWYAADGFGFVWQAAGRIRFGREILEVVFIGVVVFFFQIFRQSLEPKLGWTNQKDMETMEKIWHIIPKDAYVLDLVGATIYYKDPYYACCLPIGQYRAYMSRPLPSLETALDQTKTAYIYQGSLRRIGTLTPEDQAYIDEHYVPTFDGDLFVRK